MSAGIRQGADFDVRKCRSALADVLLPMVWLGAVLGLRWSEVAGLRVGRLDVLRRTVTVAEAVTRDAQGRPVFTAPKSTAGARTLAMPAWLAEMLAEHLARLGTTAVDASELMFPAAEEGPLRYDNWRRRVWQPACVAASVGTVTKDPETKRERYSGAGFHDLRRANATGLVLAGVDLKTAQNASRAFRPAPHDWPLRAAHDRGRQGRRGGPRSPLFGRFAGCSRDRRLSALICRGASGG